LLGPYKALSYLTPEGFLGVVTESREQLKSEIASLPEDNGIPPELTAKKWVADMLLYEAKRGTKQIQSAEQELTRMKRGTLDLRVRELQQNPTGDKYQDVFNRLVCRTADQGGISLPQAEKIITNKIASEINDNDLLWFLAKTNQEQLENRLRDLFLKKVASLGYSNEAEKLTLLLFELDQIKVDSSWGVNLEQTLIEGVRGEALNLITVLCTINEFDYKGGYTCISDLNAYLENPKLEPVPLILDELNQVLELFSFYGIQSTLTILVADTDYTEVGQYGPVNTENLTRLKSYLKNLQTYVSKFGKQIKVIPLSSTVDSNITYSEVKSRIYKKVSNFKDPDFQRKWYQKFEDMVEKVVEGQRKKRLFPKDQVRQKALEITKNIWACQAALGAVLSQNSSKTIFISTERRERDINYVVDEKTTTNFPPVIYILRAAEAWNRKLTGKID